MSNPFASPRLTILRAQHHIDDFNARINEFVNSQPWSYVIEKDSKGSQVLHKIKFARRLPPNLPCILFDASNNLRATLDQAGYASAVASGKVDPKQTKFPFGDDPVGLDNVIRRNGSKDLPPEILTLFRGFKPYKGGNDTLWALNKLCNTKKHCALMPFNIGQAALALTQSAGPTRSFGPGFMAISGSETISGYIGAMGVTNRDWDPDKYEITLARTVANTSPNYRANVALNVAIEGIETQSRKPAVGVLRDMMRVVDCILSATEAECRRLGFLK